MRLIDVVLGCVLLGLVVAFLQVVRPGTAGAEARSTVGERITWLRAPILRRTSAVQ
jgi:hypothetical protein